jgi:hypothetical protein
MNNASEDARTGSMEESQIRKNEEYDRKGTKNKTRGMKT